MCSKCGASTTDILIRAASYTAVRYGLDSKMADDLLQNIVKVEKEHMNWPAKFIINAGIDYVYDKWVYDPEKMKGYSDYLGMCPCEYMKGAWELIGQLAYEGMMNKVSVSDVIKESVAIWAQFPIQHLVQGKVKY